MGVIPPAWATSSATSSATTASLLNRLNGDLLVELTALSSLGAREEHDVAWAQARSRDPARLVVVGETKRGKSMLVNALVGAGPLSPVGADETTATYVSLIPTTEVERQGTCEVIAADGSRHPIPSDDLAVHADLRRRSLADVAIGVDRYIAPGPLGPLVVTDTPGVGSLRDSAGELTRRAAARGGGLLFVVDAGSPISAPELAFLDQCATSIEFVVVAVTMIDKYPDTAAQMVDHVACQLARHSVRTGRFPVVGVSALAAQRAEVMSDSPVRTALVEYSGVPELAQLVRTVGDRRQLLPAVNGLRTCRSGFDRLRRVLVDQRRQLAEDLDALPGLKAEQARLADLQSAGSRWRPQLEHDLAQHRAGVGRLIQARLDEIDHRWQARLGRAPYVRQARFRQVAGRELSADFQLLRQDISVAFVDGLRAVLEEMFDPDPLPPAVQALLEANPTEGEQIDLAATRTVSVVDPSLLISASSGAGLVRTIAGFAGGAVMLPTLAPFMAVAAAGMLTLTWLTRSQRQEHQGLIADFRRHLQTERALVLDAVDTVIRDLRLEIALTYDQHLTERRSAIEATVRSLKAQAQSGATELAGQRSALDAEIATLAAHIRRIDDDLAMAARHEVSGHVRNKGDAASL